MSGTRWRIVHRDARRQVLTLERARRFFPGRYRVLPVADVERLRVRDVVELDTGRR